MLYLVIHRWFLMLPEADHTSTSSAKVKKEWTNTSAPPYVCMVCTVTTFLHFFFIIKPTRCTNFTNLFWHETLHVSDSSSVHHQQFIHCTLSNGVCHICCRQLSNRTRMELSSILVLLEGCQQSCIHMSLLSVQ